MSGIIYLAPQPHHCAAPGVPFRQKPTHLPPGTIWECDCGKRWLRKDLFHGYWWTPVRWYHRTHKKIQAHQRLITRRAANQ